MTERNLTPEQQEQAALYALGALGTAETKAFEQRLRSGSALLQAEVKSFQTVADELAFSVQPVRPAPSLKERLLARIEGHMDFKLDASGGLTFVKSSEGTWQEMAPGISAKVLFFDPVSRRATALVRMAAGTNYTPHRHAEAEELYVLDGGCFCGGRELKAGDYHRAEAGSVHHETSSDEGCLLIVISSPQNEMLG